MKCIETSFLTNSTSSLAASSDLEVSNYYSTNESHVSSELSRLHQLDLSKLNTSYSYFRRSDNTAYYSLVDESLVLSDYSDINEERLQEMSDQGERDDSIRVEPQARDKPEKSASESVEDRREEAVTSSAIVEHLNFSDLSTRNHEIAKERKSKFFNDNSGAAPRKGRSFKFFIDASDLIDDEEANDDKSPGLPDEATHPDSLNFTDKSNFERQGNGDGERTRHDKQTPDSLDDLPETNAERYGAELRAKLQKDFYNASIAGNRKPVEEERCVFKCIDVAEKVPNVVECERFIPDDAETENPSDERPRFFAKNSAVRDGIFYVENTASGRSVEKTLKNQDLEDGNVEGIRPVGKNSAWNPSVEESVNVDDRPVVGSHSVELREAEKVNLAIAAPVIPANCINLAASAEDTADNRTFVVTEALEAVSSTTEECSAISAEETASTTVAECPATLANSTKLERVANAEDTADRYSFVASKTREDVNAAAAESPVNFNLRAARAEDTINRHSFVISNAGELVSVSAAECPANSAKRAARAEDTVDHHSFVISKTREDAGAAIAECLVIPTTTFRRSVSAEDTTDHYSFVINKGAAIAECPTTPANSFKRAASAEDTVDQPSVTSPDFARFKMFLTEKYDCATKNHAYSDDERERLKIFDELIGHDKRFEHLKCNLEEIVHKRLTTKTQVAMHKFLVKQYEKRHGTDRVSSFVKTLVQDILSKRRTRETDPNQDANTEDVDELLKKLLHAPRSPVPRKRDNAPEPVAAGKSCGFFIDLKDNPKPANEARQKSAPSKQLFSMFIDFGNSTDSDSSIEVQNKFERRKKQYISKLEKSRELRNSVTSLNEESEGSRAERMAQSTPPPTGTNSIAEVVANPPVPAAENETFLAVVTKRCKNGSPHPHEIRRSWNVDKTSDINRNVITKHKRSYSVTSQKNLPIEAVPCAGGDGSQTNGDEDGNEFPSIGNADSTNELTANGESEMSNGQSYSEREGRKVQSYTSHSNSNGVVYDRNQNHPPKTDQIVEDRKVFVKLSDMDKEPKTIHLSKDQWSSIRMTKSATGTETNWFETKLLNGSVNSRSLSRIFPDLSANVLSKPNSDVDDTTVSSISSIQSSSAVSTCGK